MTEAVRFSSGKTNKNTQIKKLGPQPAHLKSTCLNSNISEEIIIRRAYNVFYY